MADRPHCDWANLPDGLVLGRDTPRVISRSLGCHVSTVRKAAQARGLSRGGKPERRVSDASIRQRRAEILAAAPDGRGASLMASNGGYALEGECCAVGVAREWR